MVYSNAARLHSRRMLSLRHAVITGNLACGKVDSGHRSTQLERVTLQVSQICGPISRCDPSQVRPVSKCYQSQFIFRIKWRWVYPWLQGTYASLLEKKDFRAGNFHF